MKNYGYVVLTDDIVYHYTRETSYNPDTLEPRELITINAKNCFEIPETRNVIIQYHDKSFQLLNYKVTNMGRIEIKALEVPEGGTLIKTKINTSLKDIQIKEDETLINGYNIIIVE